MVLRLSGNSQAQFPCFPVHISGPTVHLCQADGDRMGPVGTGNIQCAHKYTLCSDGDYFKAEG